MELQGPSGGQIDMTEVEIQDLGLVSVKDTKAAVETLLRDGTIYDLSPEGAGIQRIREAHPGIKTTVRWARDGGGTFHIAEGDGNRMPTAG